MATCQFKYSLTPEPNQNSRWTRNFILFLNSNRGSQVAWEPELMWFLHSTLPTALTSCCPTVCCARDLQDISNSEFSRDSYCSESQDSFSAPTVIIWTKQVHPLPETGRFFKKLIPRYLLSLQLSVGFGTGRHWPLLGTLCKDPVESIRAVMLYPLKTQWTQGLEDREQGGPRCRQQELKNSLCHKQSASVLAFHHWCSSYLLCHFNCNYTFVNQDDM